MDSPLFGKALEVEVRYSLEKAMKILKQKMSKEGVLQELKRRRFYEKPSVRKKRKMREARKRLRREMKRRTGGPEQQAPRQTKER
jgi:small subunit ribosomal protein S21